MQGVEDVSRTTDAGRRQAQDTDPWVDGSQEPSASHIGVANLSAPQGMGRSPHHLLVKGRIAQLG